MTKKEWLEGLFISQPEIVKKTYPHLTEQDILEFTKFSKWHSL